MPREVRSFLEDALGEIARSEPEADRALRAALRGLRARLSDGALSFVLQADGEGWRFCDGAGTADIAVAFDEAVILDLIEGALTLNEAILGERITYLGPLTIFANSTTLCLFSWKDCCVQAERRCCLRGSVKHK